MTMIPSPRHAGLLIALVTLFAPWFAEPGAQTPPTIAPLASGLRDALYADAALEELVDQFAALPDLEEPVTQIRSGKAAATAALLEKRADRASFVITVIRAFAHREAGDRARAIALLRTLTASADARIELQAYRLLNEIGEQAPAAARAKALGGLVEFGSAGEPVVIAGFADGNARVFFRDGRAVEGTGENSVVAAKALVLTLGRHRNHLRPERSRELPGPNQVRFVLLTPGGVFDRTLTAAELKQPGSPFVEILATARRLQAASMTAR